MGIEKFPLSIKYGIMDADYDYTPIYLQLFQINAHFAIAYNKRREEEIIGLMNMLSYLRSRAFPLLQQLQ